MDVLDSLYDFHFSKDDDQNLSDHSSLNLEETQLDSILEILGALELPMDFDSPIPSGTPSSPIIDFNEEDSSVTQLALDALVDIPRAMGRLVRNKVSPGYYKDFVM